MRKFLTVAMVLAVIGSLAALDVGDEPAVSVREAGLRAAPGFLGTIVGQLEYGQSVTILEARGDWYRVRTADTGAEGWLHTSALAEKQALRLEQAGSAGTGGATSREIALAGRGFNEQVEAQYKSDKGLDFSLVDEMETWGQPIDELGEFLAAAGLSVDGGQQ